MTHGEEQEEQQEQTAKKWQHKRLGAEEGRETDDEQSAKAEEQRALQQAQFNFDPHNIIEEAAGDIDVKPVPYNFKPSYQQLNHYIEAWERSHVSYAMDGRARVNVKIRPRDSSTKVNKDSQYHLKTMFILVHGQHIDDGDHIPKHWERAENNVLMTQVMAFDTQKVQDCVIFSRPAEYLVDGTAYMAQGGCSAGPFPDEQEAEGRADYVCQATPVRGEDALGASLLPGCGKFLEVAIGALMFTAFCGSHGETPVGANIVPKGTAATFLRNEEWQGALNQTIKQHDPFVTAMALPLLGFQERFVPNDSTVHWMVEMVRKREEDGRVVLIQTQDPAKAADGDTF